MANPCKGLLRQRSNTITGSAWSIVSSYGICLSRTPASVRYLTAYAANLRNGPSGLWNKKDSDNNGDKDPFDKLGGESARPIRFKEREYNRDNSSSSDRDSGKFGRPSFGQRDFRNRSSANSNFFERENRGRDRNNVRDRDQDRYGDSSSNSSYSKRNNDTSSFKPRESSSSSAPNDSGIPRGSSSPRSKISKDNDYLYSPNVVLPALMNNYRKSYTLYYSKILEQKRK
ncbi:hypothetical protein BX616_008481, partial [Lobosporangium transversale]